MVFSINRKPPPFKNLYRPFGIFKHRAPFQVNSLV
jgi:hypothetical protein